ncbi:MAG: 16S rRNA (uracil(1498)-N(3))-methyltransferase [Deltaproteobacteria bacterium]|nr:16S rRNA (uracil(1498)-N(3))-methyltransferase [Deltaproteobacteria bacterium]
MNLLLVDAREVAADGVVAIDGRRAEHLRAVLGAGPGDRVKAGIAGGGIGTAEVLADDGARVTLRLAIAGPAPAPLPIELVLAVPRPKVLTRVIEAAAAFGVARVTLTNAWRVDKSYLRSPRTDAAALAEAARLGAEQGAHTHLPPIELHERLMPLLDARWPAGDARGADDGATKLIAHPGAPPIELHARGGPTVLAIGPEGGWIAREVETFAARGFAPVSLGTAILRVETAVAAALGQLVLLARRYGETAS